jgi:hypothetical protein
VVVVVFELLVVVGENSFSDLGFGEDRDVESELVVLQQFGVLSAQNASFCAEVEELALVTFQEDLVVPTSQMVYFRTASETSLRMS